MKIKLFICIVLFLALIKPSKAEELFTQCNSCYSSSSFLNVASYVGETEGDKSNIVYVSNFKTETLHKYRVIYIESREPGVPDDLIVSELALTSDDMTNKNSLFTKYNELVSYTPDVPVDIAETAYDLIGSSSTQNNVENFYVSNQSVVDRLNNLTAVVLGLAGKIVNVSFVIELSFNDGSYANFTITGIDKNGNITLKLSSAVDADNNNIPITKSEIQNNGAMNFSTQNGLQNYINAAARYGIPIIYNGGGGSSGGSLTCKVNTSGGLTCVYKPK